MNSLTDTLEKVVTQIEAGSLDAARESLNTLMSSVDLQREPRDVRYLIFGGALARRLSEEAVAEANLYLNDFEVPQIRLFNLLGQHVPLVTATSRLANDLILDAAAGLRRVQLMDVGIGTGRQMVGVLEGLAARPEPPEDVLIIGIEPSGWSLELAKETVLATAARLGLCCRFYPVHGTAERLPAQQWRQLEALCERPIINASFALHHILDIHGEDVRSMVLAHLRRLQPRALILLEPDVHHLEPDFRKRFHNCFTHFSQVFDLLDDLDIPQEDRNALKVSFFGREIFDILGNDNEVRTERHEATTSWLDRLGSSGFSPTQPGIELPACRPAELQRRGQVFSVVHADNPLVSVLYAQPAPGEPPPSPSPTLQKLIAAAAPFETSHRRPLDARLYLAALRAMADADGRIRDGEFAFLHLQARIFDVDLDALPSFEDLLDQGALPEPDLAAAIVRDVIFLAHLDDEYVEVEQARAQAIAERLGLADDFDLLEQSVLRVLPRALQKQPSWFREQWFMSQKTL